MHEHDPRRHRLIFTDDLDTVPAGAALWGARHRAPTSTADLHQALHRAIRDALTDKQRQAVELFFFEGLSQGEIARRAGVSQQVIQKRLYGTRRGGRQIGGALAKLRRALERHHLNPEPPTTP